MTDTIRFEFQYSSHVHTGQGKLVRMDDRGPVIVDAETGGEFLVPWASVVRDGSTSPRPLKQKTLFGDQ